jgi:hypothetical protein
MNLRRMSLVLAIAAGLLGTAHLALTPLLYSDWTIDSLGFVGSGLAMLTGAGANLLGIGVADRRQRAGLLLMNLAMTAFFASAWPVLPEPQVVVGGILFAGLAVSAAFSSHVAPERGQRNAW